MVLQIVENLESNIPVCIKGCTFIEGPGFVILRALKQGKAFMVLTPSMGNNPQKGIALMVFMGVLALDMLFRASKVKPPPEFPTSNLRVFKNFKGTAFNFLTAFMVLKPSLQNSSIGWASKRYS